MLMTIIEVVAGEQLGSESTRAVSWCLPTPDGLQSMNTPTGLFGLSSLAAAGLLDALADRLHRRDPGRTTRFFQLVGDGQHLGNLVLDHPARSGCRSNRRPPRLHRISVDHAEHHRLVALGFVHRFQRRLQRHDVGGIVDVGRRRRLGAFGRLDGGFAGRCQRVAGDAHAVERGLLLLPLGVDLVERTVVASAIPAPRSCRSGRPRCSGPRVRAYWRMSELDVSAWLDPPLAVLHRLRRRVLRDRDAGRWRCVEQRDRALSGNWPPSGPARSAAKPLDRRLHRLVQHHDVVVLLHHRRDRADHRDRLVGLRFADVDGLESAGQRRVASRSTGDIRPR